MLMRHHDQTRELEMRQQKSVHVLREEHLRRQHDTELTNQVIETAISEAQLARPISTCDFCMSSRFQTNHIGMRISTKFLQRGK